MSTVVCPLASGSLGNALLVRTDRTALLVDMGITQKRLRASLATAGASVEDLDAILLTHTHRDHFSRSAVGLCLRHAIPVYSTPENLAHFADRLPRFGKLAAAGLARPIDDVPVDFGGETVEAFRLPHDARGNCLGFRIETGPARRRRRVAVATDLGHLPAEALPHFLDCDAVVLESNHDPDMLAGSNRPGDLIRRIAGPHGHLSNGAAAEAIAEIVGRSHPGRVRHVVLAHLSRDCNTPEIALEAQAYLSRRRQGDLSIAAATQFIPGPCLAL